VETDTGKTEITAGTVVGADRAPPASTGAGLRHARAHDRPGIGTEAMRARTAAPGPAPAPAPARYRPCARPHSNARARAPPRPCFSRRCPLSVPRRRRVTTKGL
jgi:hypothetical protein